ncbi:hypothetical protein ACFVS2_26690 [Brevibacillus sp. NPDC058079]|uniref:hypothetical protein n=1 Tax=Brevibacillus sp. NPDC058079 TaxID=3346330 RepID=UPI0036E27306
MFSAIVGKVIQKDEHHTRLFGTKWNSPLSIRRLNRPSQLGKRGLYFHDGYCELYVGRWIIKYRNSK